MLIFFLILLSKIKFSKCFAYKETKLDYHLKKNWRHYCILLTTHLTQRNYSIEDFLRKNDTRNILDSFFKEKKSNRSEKF